MTREITQRINLHPQLLNFASMENLTNISEVEVSPLEKNDI